MHIIFQITDSNYHKEKLFPENIYETPLIEIILLVKIYVSSHGQILF